APGVAAGVARRASAVGVAPLAHALVGRIGRPPPARAVALVPQGPLLDAPADVLRRVVVATRFQCAVVPPDEVLPTMSVAAVVGTMGGVGAGKAAGAPEPQPEPHAQPSRPSHQNTPPTLIDQPPGVHPGLTPSDRDRPRV